MLGFPSLRSRGREIKQLSLLEELWQSVLAHEGDGKEGKEFLVGRNEATAEGQNGFADGAGTVGAGERKAVFGGIGAEVLRTKQFQVRHGPAGRGLRGKQANTD